jgi:CHASE1-domain containing sensor protein
MPLVAWMFKFWLQPQKKWALLINGGGGLLILIALGLMRSIFHGL